MAAKLVNSCTWTAGRQEMQFPEREERENWSREWRARTRKNRNEGRRTAMKALATRTRHHSDLLRPLSPAATNAATTRYSADEPHHQTRHPFPLSLLVLTSKHEQHALSMSSSRSLTAVLVAVVAALVTGLLLLRSPDRAPVTAASESRSQTSEQVSSRSVKAAVRPEQTFLQRMKGTDLSDIMPLYPSGPLLISELDSFNNLKIAPRLQSIVAMDYFRFVKLNLSKKCSLWPDDARCAERSVCGSSYGREVGNVAFVLPETAPSNSARIRRSPCWTKTRSAVTDTFLVPGVAVKSVVSHQHCHKWMPPFPQNTRKRWTRCSSARMMRTDSTSTCC